MASVHVNPTPDAPDAPAGSGRLRSAGFAAVGASTLLGLASTGLRDASLLGLSVPSLVPAALVLVGGGLGAAGVARRAPGLSLGGAGAMVVGLALTVSAATPVAYALGLAFAVSALAWVELTFIAAKQDRARRADGGDAEATAALDRVAGETLRTLVQRLGLTAAAVGAGVGIAFLLRFAGPRLLRAAVETTAPLGIALATLLLFGAAGLYVLSRGASLRRSPQTSSEVDPDVAE